MGASQLEERMTTITEPVAPEERLVATPENQVLFICRREDLKLVKVPIYPVYGPSGQKVGEHRGERVGFKGIYFRCPKEGTVELEGGVKVDAAEVIEWLENHRLFGNSEEGFWRLDPVAPAPTREELEAMMNAAIELDEDLLERLLEQERGGWKREDVIETAETALERIRKVKAEAKAQAEAEAKKAGQQPPVPPETPGA